MYKFLATASIVILLSSPPASAMTFLYSGTLDSYTVQESGNYAFTVAGAQGGYDPIWVSSPCCGGGGAVISGDIYLDAGDVLTILAGGAGNLANEGDGGSGGSGGGMSFLSIGQAPLIVAGGGAGANWKRGATQPGSAFDGQIESGDGFGGQAAAWSYGGSGAGWMSAGASSTALGAGQGGSSWDGGFAGGAGYVPAMYSGIPGFGVAGGFGGGGGSGYSGGGGGGGYSGGSSANGGGSFIDASATNIEAIAGGNFISGRIPMNGYVTLDFMGAVFAAASLVSAAPEPGTWALFLLGFGAVGYAMRRQALLAASKASSARAVAAASLA